MTDGLDKCPPKSPRPPRGPAAELPKRKPIEERTVVVCMNDEGTTCWVARDGKPMTNCSLVTVYEGGSWVRPA